MTASSSSVPRRGRRLRRVLLALLLVVVLLLAATALAVWRLGPRYGLTLGPPSPQQYVEIALARMDAGYYATGEEWQQAKATARAATAEAGSYAETLPALRTAIEVAGGHHSRIFEPGQSLAEASPERTLPAASTASGVTTLVVPGVTADDEEFLQSYATTLSGSIDQARSATTCGWIVDLRHNHGGDMNPMLSGLSPLLPDGAVGGFRDRTGKVTELSVSGGDVAIGGQTSFSGPDVATVDQPIAVLQGPDNGSSGEVSVLAFTAQSRARSFGEPTAGYSSANQTITLYDGTQMLLTTAVDVDAHGTPTEGEPIPPDEAVPADQAEDAARAWLATQCGG